MARVMMKAFEAVGLLAVGMAAAMGVAMAAAHGQVFPAAVAGAVSVIAALGASRSAAKAA